MSNLPKKTRILLLTDCLSGLTAGAERNIYELAKRLDKKMFTVILGNLECDGKTPQNLIESLSCEFAAFPVKRIYGISGLREGFRFMKFLKEKEIDILQTYHFSSDIWGTFFAHCAGVSCIISNRRDMGFWRNRWHILAYRLINRWVNKIIVVAQAIKEIVINEEKVDQNKIEVIYNGVDITNFADQPIVSRKSEFGINEGDIVIACVGNLKPVKGHQYLLAALAKIVPENPAVKLLLVGEDGLNGKLQWFADKLNIVKNVNFLGRRSKVSEILKLSDICVLPSLSEGMSNAILEYMAAGKPVVATKVGGNAEMIEDGFNGILVEKENSVQLQEALLRLLKDPNECVVMGDNGLKRAHEYFSMLRMVNKYEKLYKLFSRTQKRILHVVSSGGLFGAENVILSLGEHFNHNGTTSFIGALIDKRNPHDEIIECAKNKGIPTVAIKSNGPVDLRAILFLAQYLKENKISLLHTHNYKSDIIGFFAAKMAGVPVIATAHGFTRMNKIVAFYERLDRLILNFFNRVVAVTGFVFNKSSRKKRTIIENGLEVSRFGASSMSRQRIREQFGFKESDIVIGTVGRLSPEKNQQMLLEAAFEIFEEFDHARLLIVGSGPEELYLKKVAKILKIDKKVFFAGLLKDMPSIYPVLDIFVLTSLTEGLPLTILESMAARIPVVATNVGGIPNVIKDNVTGLLVESNNVSQLVRQLSTLIINEQKRLDLSNRAFECVTQRYSHNRMLDQYEALYQEVLN